VGHPFRQVQTPTNFRLPCFFRQLADAVAGKMGKAELGIAKPSLKKLGD
jgi:hypothetical protein